jgi:hypothetical protein
MTIRFYADEFRTVIYEEAPGGGDPVNPESAMNRPVISPMDWLNNIHFHSDFDYYNTFMHQQVVLTHAGYSAGSTVITPHLVLAGGTYEASWHLVTHSLGYIPKFFVAVSGRMMSHSYPVQSVAGEAGRFVSAFATETTIGLYELAVTGLTYGLPAQSILYDILVFADSAPDPTLKQLDIQPGVAIFGQGKFRMDRPPLRQAISGESPFSQALGKTSGINNGSIRVFQPNGDMYDIGPYAGSLTAPAFVNLQAGI